MHQSRYEGCEAEAANAYKTFLGCREKLGGKRLAATFFRSFKVHSFPKISIQLADAQVFLINFQS